MRKGLSHVTRGLGVCVLGIGIVVAGPIHAAPEHIELAQATKTETAQDVFTVLSDAVGIRKLPLSNIKRDGSVHSATVTLRGKTITLYGFSAGGTSMAALVPPADFALSDVLPMPTGTPVDGVKFEDMALIYVPAGHQKTSISANAFPADVKTAIRHVGQNVPLAVGLNLFGQADFNGVQPIRKLMSAVGHNNLKMPVSSALPAGIFGYNLKTASQSVKNQLLQNLKLSLVLPNLSIPGMPNMVEVDDAHLSVVGHKPKTGDTKVYAGVTGTLKVKISGKQNSFNFGMFAPDPGKQFNPELTAESKDTVKIPFVHPLTLSNMQLVAKRKNGSWDAVVNASTKLNNKDATVTYRHDPNAGDSAEIDGKFTLADIAPGGDKIPGLTDVEFDDIIIRKGFVEAKGKVKGIETDVVSAKIGGKHYIAVANPKPIKISSLISAAAGTPLDAASFEHMNYIYAPQGGAVTNFNLSDLGGDVESNVKRVISSVNLKVGLNVIGRMTIEKNSGLGSLLNSVGAYKSSLNLVGTLSPKIFQANQAGQIKKEILDGLDFKLPLPTPKLHGAPKSVGVQNALLTIKGGNDAINADVSGRLDFTHGSSKAEFDFDAKLVRKAGQNKVEISANEVPGTAFTFDTVTKFKLTNMTFGMANWGAGGGWLVRLNADSTINGTAIKLEYAHNPGESDFIDIQTENLTLATLIGEKGLPGLDDVKLTEIKVNTAANGLPAYMTTKATVKDIKTVIQVQKGWSKGHFVAVYLRDFDLGKIIPGAGSSALKDVKFANVTMVYSPEAEGALLDKSSLVHAAQSWIRESSANPMIQPGMNIFGHMDIEPTGELGKLLHQVGVNDLKLPLSGSFSPKALAQSVSAQAIKNEILDHLDVHVPLPTLKVPKLPGHVKVQHAKLAVTGKDANGDRALTVDVAGRLDFTHGSSKADFDFDMKLVKKSGEDKVEISAKEVPGTKLTFDMVEKFELSNMTLGMANWGNASGGWLVRLNADSKINNTAIKLEYAHNPGQSDFIDITPTNLTIAKLIGDQGLPGLDDVKLTEITVHTAANGLPAYMITKATVKNIKTVIQVQKGWSTGHFVAVYLRDINLGNIIPGASNSPLSDVDFSNVTMVYSPENASALLSKSSLVHAAQSWVRESSADPEIQPGMNIFGHLDIEPTGKLGKLMSQVGVKKLKLPLNGGFSKQALSPNVSGDAIKNAILDHLDIKIALGKLTLPGVGDHLTFKNDRLEIKGKLPDGSRGLAVHVASDAEIKIKDQDFAFSVAVDYDRSPGAAATDLEIKGHTDKPWNKPFGISFLDLESLTFDVKKQKDAEGNKTYDLDIAAKTDIGSHSKLDVTIDVHEENGKLTGATFELDGPLKLSEIPGVKDVPEAGKFEIDTIKISEHGIEAKTDFGQNNDLDVYLFTGSGWNFVMRQDNFAITEFVPPLNSTPLKHIKLSEAAVVLSKDGLKGQLADFSPIAQDALKDIYGANTAEVDVQSGLSLVAAFEHKNAGGGLSGALKRLGLSEERVVLTGDIGGIFGGPVKLDVEVDLSAHTGAKHQPSWAKSKPGVEAVFSLTGTESDGQFDVEIGIGTDIAATMHGTKLDFTAKTALEFEDEKIDVKIVADLKDKKGWKKPFGIPGLTVYEVGFDLGIDVEGAVHMGFDGDVKISGDTYNLAFDADLEGGAIPTDLALVASADKVDIFFIEEIAVAMMGNGFKLDIPENVFPTFTGIKKPGSEKRGKLKFAFATPGAQDPDLNITGEGFALKGAMNWLDHEVGSMDLSINPTSGIVADGKIDDITLGGILTLKNNQFDLKATIKSVPSLKVNGDISVLGLDDRVEVKVDKKGILFKSSLSDGPSFKADIDFDVKYDVSAKKPDFKNADIFMSGDVHLDLKKFIQGPAVSALNTIFTDLNSGFAAAEKALKAAEKKVDGLTTKINAERAKVRKERAKAEARIKSAEDRVNGIKGVIADDWHHYHHCHGWGKYVCKAKWGIKIGFEKGGLAIADEALKLAEELVAHFPIDLDPRVAALILERDGAKAALHLAEEAVKGVDFVTSFKKEADKILDDIGSAANVSIKKASFEGDLKDVINGGPVDLALDVDLWGKTVGDSFAFYLKDIGKDVEHLAMMAYYALDHMVNDLLDDVPGFLKHKVRGLIASSMDSVAAEHKRRLAKFSAKFDKYHKTAGDIQSKFANYNQAYLQEQLSKSISPLDSDTSETFSGELIEVGHSGLCLSVDKGQVLQQPCNGDAAEKWSTKAVDGAPNVKPKAGYVQITDASGSNCIVPEGTWKTAQAPFSDGSAAPAFNFGTTEFQGDGKINVGPCKNLKEFYWKVLKHGVDATASGGGWVLMANLASNKCLHFSHSSAKPGVAVAEWKSCVGSANQVFRIADNASPKYYADYISLRNDQLGLCLGEANADTTVPMVTCDKAAYYDYMVDIRGYAKFINYHSGHCLQPGGYDTGSKMTEVPCTQLDYQWWDADPQAGGIIIKNAQTTLCTNPPFDWAEVPPTQVDCASRNNAVFAPVLGKYRFTGPTWSEPTSENMPAADKRYKTESGHNLCAFEVEGSFTPGVVVWHSGKEVCATAFSDASAPERYSTGKMRLMLKEQDNDVLWYPNTGKKLARHNMPTGGFGGASAANIYTCRSGTANDIGWTADGKTCHIFNFASAKPVKPATDFDILSRWDKAYYQLQGSAAADIEQPTSVPSFPLPPPVKTAPVWLVGTDNSPYAWNAKVYGWIRQKGCIKQITVNSDGVPYAVQCDDYVVRWTGTGWTGVGGGLKALDVGYGGRLYAIDKDKNPRQLYNGSWIVHPTCAERIDVTWGGTPLIIACDGDVKRLSGNSWVSMDAGAGNKDIATGNQTWVLGESGKAWEQVDSKWQDKVADPCMSRIDVAGDGTFWAIGCDGNVYAQDGTGANKMPGRGLDIGMNWK